MSELVVPGTGEILNLDDPIQCAQALGDIRQLERQLRDLKSELTLRVASEARRQGTKTLDLGGGSQAVVAGGTELVWDFSKLGELVRAGLPAERYRELVVETVERKVDAGVAKRISAANPEYARIIDEARSVYEKPVYITIRRRV